MPLIAFSASFFAFVLSKFISVEQLEQVTLEFLLNAKLASNVNVLLQFGHSMLNF